MSADFRWQGVWQVKNHAECVGFDTTTSPGADRPTMQDPVARTKGPAHFEPRPGGHLPLPHRLGTDHFDLRNALDSLFLGPSGPGTDRADQEQSER